MFCKNETGSRQGYWQARIPKTNLFQVTRKDMETSTMFGLQHDNFIVTYKKVISTNEKNCCQKAVKFHYCHVISSRAMQCNAMQENINVDT
jgi:hypothetical protein